jgi:hypothetical protein
MGQVVVKSRLFEIAMMTLPVLFQQRFDQFLGVGGRSWDVKDARLMNFRGKARRQRHGEGWVKVERDRIRDSQRVEI